MRTFLVSVLSMIGLGCGGASSTPASVGHRDVGPRDALVAWQRAGCEKAHACRASFDETRFDTSFEGLYGAAVGECAGRTETYVDETLTAADAEALRSAIARGTYTFRAAEAEGCIERDRVARAAQDCDAFWTERLVSEFEDGACATFIGTVPVGGACQIDAECADDGSTCTDGTCVGTENLVQ